MPLSAISSVLDPLRNLYRGQRSVPLALTQINVADIFTVHLFHNSLAVTERDAHRLMEWAPDGILRVPPPGTLPVINPTFGAMQLGLTFAAGCMVGATALVSPLSSALMAAVLFTALSGTHLPFFI